ncbi:hypothetical protein FPSE_10102 [Fusarium pseudograminearum CS3096]|uniref:Uncharacterized protein n=1 Tax=Fusarium pseudograminearum (strain CS3096) TaxID=1028729 RepID=K3VBK7_FUSPC|nr:hypothetical protein FPSE_10102 [Fusarium pseudograminearum CS3096]EKJ69688.1 hypothetical protein FPSE_10102 [Fusarium pseudograminearum CS3096]
MPTTHFRIWSMVVHHEPIREVVHEVAFPVRYAANDNFSSSTLTVIGSEL